MTFEQWWKDCMGWTEYEPDQREKALAKAAWGYMAEVAKSAYMDGWHAGWRDCIDHGDNEEVNHDLLIKAFKEEL